MVPMAEDWKQTFASNSYLTDGTEAQGKAGTQSRSLRVPSQLEASSRTQELKPSPWPLSTVP